MAFKGESDDTRSSLSYKLKRLLRFRAKSVLCTDPFVANDPNLEPLETVLDQSDVLIVGAPHEMYSHLDTPKPIIDIWNVRQLGVKV
jgi:UDP-N-acetyl-D-mannosaminuronic acid dehydrogenase